MTSAAVHWPVLQESMRSRAMSKTARKALIFGVIALAATAGYATVAAAQSQQTPKGWSYEIKDGKRVPKGNRITNPDGSSREEVRQGNCVTIKERSASGEYKETRQCNPGGNPGEALVGSLKLPFGLCLIAHSGSPL